MDFNRESFQFHIKWYNALRRMEPSVRLELTDAIMRKAFFNESTELSPEASSAWAFIEPEVEQDTDRWLDIRQKRSQCGAMGGRPKANESKQKQKKQLLPNAFPQQDTIPAVTESKVKRFVKPTIEDVRAYVSEKGYSFDPESFFAFYESKGWVVGKNPMKNWRAACTTWQKGRNNNSNGYERETVSDKIRRSVDSATEFSQQLKNRIGQQAELDW